MTMPKQEDEIKICTAVGAEGKPYACVTIGDRTITAYESLINPGVLVIDIAGDFENLKIALNDDYIHQHVRQEV